MTIITMEKTSISGMFKQPEEAATGVTSRGRPAPPTFPRPLSALCPGSNAWGHYTSKHYRPLFLALSLSFARFSHSHALFSLFVFFSSFLLSWNWWCVSWIEAFWIWIWTCVFVIPRPSLFHAGFLILSFFMLVFSTLLLSLLASLLLSPLRSSLFISHIFYYCIPRPLSPLLLFPPLYVSLPSSPSPWLVHLYFCFTFFGISGLRWCVGERERGNGKKTKDRREKVDERGNKDKRIWSRLLYHWKKKLPDRMLSPAAVCLCNCLLIDGEWFLM